MQKNNEKNSLIEDINSILEKYKIGTSITLSDITITDETVSDLVKQDARLSDAITNHLWPSIKSKTVYHFTSKDAAESILNSGVFRLNNIERRYNEGEIETFCKTHKLNGYLEKDQNGNPKYRDLIMPNTFYASFTDASLTTEQEEYFWRNFASCDGVRLKIKITALSPDFRKIYYEKTSGHPIELLEELKNCIKRNYNREFVFKGISRLCAFYLCGEDYGIEGEYRVLHRVWEDSSSKPKGLGAQSYVELPLGEMNECRYKLDIIEVHAREKPKMPERYLFSHRSV